VKLRQPESKVAGANTEEIKNLTIAEIAQQFGVSVTTVFGWTMQGCPVTTVKGQHHLKLKDVIRWKRENSR
jgi:phage terminase Nu1 subunit (DNA packaging protein)